MEQRDVISGLLDTDTKWRKEEDRRPEMLGVSDRHCPGCEDNPYHPNERWQEVVLESQIEISG